MNILVSNLNCKTTSEHLSALFVKFGLVLSSKIIRDNITGFSMGYALVVMHNQSGTVAIHELNSMKFMNYYLEVTEAPL